MKILTLSILASLTLGAAALPATVAYDGPGTTQRTQVIYVDTADTSDEAPSRVQSVDEQTLIQIHGLPDEPKNRDLDVDYQRTYNQRNRIESDYGREIEREIIMDRGDARQKWSDQRY